MRAAEKRLRRYSVVHVGGEERLGGFVDTPDQFVIAKPADRVLDDDQSRAHPARFRLSQYEGAKHLRRNDVASDT